VLLPIVNVVAIAVDVCDVIGPTVIPGSLAVTVTGETKFEPVSVTGRLMAVRGPAVGVMFVSAGGALTVKVLGAVVTPP
jgi:hypothetical protein